MANSRAKSVTDLLTMRFKEVPFEGKWLASFGKPELSGSWLIWGNSGNGKTRLAMALCKYLTAFGRVAYNSLEEGASLSTQRAVREIGMDDVKRRFILLDKEPMNELIERLKKRKSPDIVVIDSVQYSGLNYRDYKQLRDQFRNKLFILISHAEGKEPAGRVAKSIRFDAFVKIRVEGYRADVVSRYGGGNSFVIWEQGAEEYWGTI